MRKPARLDDLYAQLMKLHKEHFPDMRFCQFWLNVLGYIQSVKYDPFYLEDDELLSCVEAYIKSEKSYFLGGNLRCYKEEV